MTAVEIIKYQLKEDLEAKRKYLDERVRAKDWAGAHRREVEIETLLSVWQIVCSSESFERTGIEQ